MLTGYQVVVKGKVVTFKSPYSNEEALDLVRQHYTREGSFGFSLANSRRLSDNQWRWVHKLAVDATSPKAAIETLELNLIKIVVMLNYAQRFGEIKYPMIRVELDDLPPIKLRLAGAASAHPFTISIFHNGQWVGRILKNGKVQPRDIDAQVLEVLKRLEADPAGTATMHGRRTGNCCFCGRELTAKDSLVCGYGPICAAKFGLPHAGMGEQDGILGLLKTWVKEENSTTAVKTVTGMKQDIWDVSGNIYVTDMSLLNRSSCWRYHNGVAQVWLSGDRTWMEWDQFIPEHDQSGEEINVWTLTYGSRRYSVLNT